MHRPDFQVLSEHPRHAELYRWCQDLGLLAPEISEFRRLQLEHWLWEQRERPQLQGLVLDIGQPTFPRTWVPGHYRTVGLHGCDETADIVAGALPLAECIICCDVLEHVDNPFRAVNNLYWSLRPGGLLLASSPFLWPYHGVQGGGDPFPDYWRFTHEGWERLLRGAGFREFTVRANEWTREGEELFDLLAAWEIMTTRPAANGYYVEAVR